jgi:predicted Abi (CAAX) family protease
MDLDSLHLLLLPRLLAALLGVVCEIAYLKTGSLWSPAAIHWLVVAVWLTVLGGYRKVVVTS